MPPAFLYELGVVGAPSPTQLESVRKAVEHALDPFGLKLGREVGWSAPPATFNPAQGSVSAAAFLGSTSGAGIDVGPLLARGVPVVPVASEVGRIGAEIPAALQSLNCLDYSNARPEGVATALLECAGLLPRRRRVFLSYRRAEAGEVATQLFDAFSKKLFDVFLDTYRILPGEDFQAALWHQLCDCDALVMLDTPNYFGSRWTSAEYGRALAKGISVLQVSWPGTVPSTRTGTATRVPLDSADLDPSTGRLSDAAVESICMQLEAVRTQSYAVRSLSLFSHLQIALTAIGGAVVAVGARRAARVQLADGRRVMVYTAVGVPTSRTLQDADGASGGLPAAVLYDHVGLLPDWLGHLEWLGDHIQAPRWIRVSEAAWQLADWAA